MKNDFTKKSAGGKPFAMDLIKKPANHIEKFLCFGQDMFKVMVLLFLMGMLNSCAFYAGYVQTIPQPEIEKKSESYPLYFYPLLKIIEHHQEVATHMDGPRCPLYPTCSHYAYTALKDHGFFGLLLFIDRLFYREFSDLDEHYIRVPYEYSKRLRYFDPLEDSFPITTEHSPSLLRDEL